MMKKLSQEHRFEANAETELYLSLVQPAWRSRVINKAIGAYLIQQALIDIADGRGVISFWRKLDFDKKAEVLRL
jgi:hypothetical protein